MYFYTVKFIDEDRPYAMDESGVISATSYQEAVERLTEYYGENDIVSMTLEAWEDIVTVDEICACAK